MVRDAELHAYAEDRRTRVVRWLIAWGCIAGAAMLALMAGQSWGQVPGAPAAAPAPTGLGGVLVQLLPGLFGLASLVLTGFLFPLLRNWLIEKAKTSAIAGAALKVEHLSENVVAHVNAGEKAMLQAKSADGELSAADGAALKTEGMRLLKESLGQEGLAAATDALGLAAPAVETYLSGALEKQVAKANAVQAVANPPAPAS